MMLVTEGGTNNLASLHNSYANRPNISPDKGTVDGCIQIANHSESDLEELKVLSDSKKMLTQTALAALLRKRNELVKLHCFLLITIMIIVYIILSSYEWALRAYTPYRRRTYMHVILRHICKCNSNFVESILSVKYPSFLAYLRLSF